MGTFWTLPRELRDEIYDEVLAYNSPNHRVVLVDIKEAWIDEERIRRDRMAIISDNRSVKPPPFPVCPLISLVVSRQFYEEVAARYFHTRTFHWCKWKQSLLVPRYLTSDRMKMHAVSVELEWPANRFNIDARSNINYFRTLKTFNALKKVKMNIKTGRRNARLREAQAFACLQSRAQHIETVIIKANMTSQLPRRDPFFDPDGEPGLEFDNSGRRSLLVPGFGHHVPIELPSGDRFAHGFQDWGQNRLTAREIAMLRLMNTITDRPRWYAEIYSPSVVALWAEQALQTHLISPAAWDWCLTELQDKADYYGKTRLTHILDSSSRICKSDELVSAALLGRISGNVENLLLREGGNLVSPDLFPLVYGKTRVLSNGGSVGRSHAISLAGQGETSGEQIWKCPRSASVNCDGTSRRGSSDGRGRGRGRGRGGGRGNLNCTRCGRTPDHQERSWEHHGGRFSADYQWLPCDVALRPHSSQQNAVKDHITSYINNLHPQRHSSLYDAIEACIEASIQPWNEVLVYRDKGRTPERIRIHNVQWSPLPAPPVHLEELDSTIDQGHGKLFNETEQWLSKFLEQPDNPRAPSPSWKYPLIEADWRKKFKPSEAVMAKHHRVKEWLHPEPGASFSYEEWKKGDNNRPVAGVHRQALGRQIPVDISWKGSHEFYTISLEKDFADRGLQVVVEIGSVELTPEEPTRPASDWQLSGLLNDHIVATTVIYFSSENLTDDSGSLTFRAEAHLNPHLHVYGTNTGSNPFHPLEPLADIYGCTSYLELGRDDDIDSPGNPALQVLGTAVVPDGRLVAFPNVVQHRVEAFALRDPTLPGRRRWLKLHLVDPHYRICSTQNVPPQQFDWWYEAGLGKIDWAAREIPTELVCEIEALVGEFPITREEAKQWEENTREERMRKMDVVNEQVPLYCFGDWAADGDSSVPLFRMACLR